MRVEGSKATVGITEYAQNALGDVVYLELPSLGLEVAKKGRKPRGSREGREESVSPALINA